MDSIALTDAQLDAMKQYGVRVIEDVQNEPVSIEQARLHLKITVDDSDDTTPYDPWLETIGIPAARAWCEGYSGLSIAEKTLELATDSFPIGGIPLPFGPVVGVSSISYVDLDDVTVVMGECDFEYDPFTQTLNPPYGESWPAARPSKNSVRVQYEVGYGDHNPMPYNVLAAVLLTLGHLDMNRENTSPVVMHEIPLGARAMLDQVKVNLGMA